MNIDREIEKCEKEWVTCPICNNDIILHEYYIK